MSMLTTAFLNSSPFHGVNLGRLGQSINANVVINTKHVSSSGFQFKSPTKVNATKVGIINCSILDSEKEGPNMVSDLGLGKLIEDGIIFQEKICIRCYEVGPNQTASIETLMNHLLETTVNHLKTIGFMHDGFGSEEMSKKNLTWAVTNIQMIVDRYPTWGDIVAIDTWKSPCGKHGVCCNMTFCDCKTGEIVVKASSIWALVNKTTRKLSKIPSEVRAEIEKYFVDTPPIVELDTETWLKKTANIDEHICKGLVPRWSDLDINRHVNHVKYIGLALESVPKSIMENYEIHKMTLQYYRECTKDSVLQSTTSTLAKDTVGIVGCDIVDCHHLLQLETEGRNIMKGRTRWRIKTIKSHGLEATFSSLTEVSNTNYIES